MSRRRISTFLAALIAAVMVGIRDSTGLAPPPPLFVTEEVHWLSPELDDELDGEVTFAEWAEPEVAREQPRAVHSSRPGRLLALRRLFARITRGGKW